MSSQPSSPSGCFTGVSLAVLLYPGWPFIAGAWRAARVGRATMDTLVVLGTWTAWFYSVWAVYGGGPTYFESAAMITDRAAGTMARVLGQRDAMRAVSALATTAAAEEAWLLPERRARSPWRPRPAGRRRARRSVVVRAGERVPVDGLVPEGTSDVDGSRLTGEPMPATVSAGRRGLGGHGEPHRHPRRAADRVASDTLTGRLAAVAEDAVFAKSHSQRLADAVAAVFVPVVLAVAAATLRSSRVTAGGRPRRAVAVLVVACPCALGLATPLAVVNAVARAHGAARSSAAAPSSSVRGTCAGRLRQDRHAHRGTRVGDRHVPRGPPRARRSGPIGTAAALEAGDPHPVAAAIAAAARERDITVSPAEHVVRHAGMGVSGTVAGTGALAGSERLLELNELSAPPDLVADALEQREAGRIVVWVAAGERVLGGVVLEDRIRPDAAPALAALARRNSKPPS